MLVLLFPGVLKLALCTDGITRMVVGKMSASGAPGPVKTTYRLSLNGTVWTIMEERLAAGSTLSS